MHTCMLGCFIETARIHEYHFSFQMWLHYDTNRLVRLQVEAAGMVLPHPLFHPESVEPETSHF